LKEVGIVFHSAPDTEAWGCHFWLPEQALKFGKVLIRLLQSAQL
jgi:hypothetical protein